MLYNHMEPQSPNVYNHNPYDVPMSKTINSYDVKIQSKNGIRADGSE